MILIFSLGICSFALWSISHKPKESANRQSTNLKKRLHFHTFYDKVFVLQNRDGPLLPLSFDRQWGLRTSRYEGGTYERYYQGN